ncbi:MULTISPECIES: hypothetical protein [Streptomyces]|uniref:hypothetical protein n=1 Tax=Streptomyces TaxID=1883 RepID=UPI00131BCAB4|nr:MULTISPECIES: hypothetical protein [Streptomyces]MDI5912017.1 hypothetical protein [Streptomyces sp. 12257]
MLWTVRLSGLVGWVAAAVACWWLLGVAATPRPWTGPLVWGTVAAGCAVVRAGALWGLRRGPGRVVLEKAGESGGALGRALGFSFDSAGWIRARNGALWLLVTFACGALFVGLMTATTGDERVAALRDAGGRVSTATVVERPRAVREDLSEDVVRGYTSRLVVAVPDGPARLATRAYTHDEPRIGTEVEVLWARSAPELGGYVHERESLRTLAAGRWEAFPDGANGRDALLAFVLTMVTVGVFALVFIFTSGPRALQRLAWSAPLQTVYAALITAVLVGWRPLLLGGGASPAEGLLGVCGFGLLVLTHMFMAGRSIGEK